MPRYHFHVEDGGHVEDRDGVELGSVRDARIEAARAIGQMVNARPDEFWKDGVFRMTVTDDQGLVLFILDLSAIDAPAVSGSSKAPRSPPPPAAGP